MALSIFGPSASTDGTERAPVQEMANYRKKLLVTVLPTKTPQNLTFLAAR